jgi:predicted metal-dependent hydrolase
VIQKKELSINGWNFVWFQVPRRRRISIHLSPGNPWTIKSPVSCTKTELQKFVYDQAEWIKKSIQKWPQPAPPWRERNRILFLGQICELKHSKTLLKKPFFSIYNNEICLFWPHGKEASDSSLSIAFKVFAQKTIPIIIEPMLKKWTHKIEQNPSSIRYRWMRSRWGSCSSRKEITFNSRLILAPLGIIEYVVVHELTHLFEMNHSQKFWKRIETALPQFKEHEKWLKDKSLDTFCY